MKTNASRVGTGNSSSLLSETFQPARSHCTVANLRNIPDCLPGSSTPVEEDLFFDALDDQPWLTPTERSWPSLNSLAMQVRSAIHSQLSILSCSTLASGLLHVFHPELSKLLAAVLICSRQRQDILWQAALSDGLELLDKCLYALTGATSAAALLSTLPGLLIIWLQRQQISLTTALIDALALLLACGLNICASEDLDQPGWLLRLQEEVIAPIARLCQESGVTEAVTLGFTLILGLYSVLRLTGWLEGKASPPNVISHGISTIRAITRLSARSHDFQQQRHLRQLAAGGQKALSRAVVRCMSKQQLLQRDARGQSADRESMDQIANEKFTLAWQQTEQKILAGQLPHCSGSKQPWVAQHMASSSALPSASAPLLVSSAVVAGIVSHRGQPGRTGWALAAAGATLLAVTGTHYFRHIRSPEAFSPLAPGLNATGNLCLVATIRVRQLLGAEYSGIRLAVELFDYIYDDAGDLDTSRADRLLRVWNITTFSSSNYQQTNNLMVDILSLLLAPPNSNHPVDIRRIIHGLGNRVNTIWNDLNENKQNFTIKKVLNELRKYCASEYFSMEIYRRRDMHKITNFLLLMAAPDLLYFERNGREEELLISKNTWYIWSYLNRQLTANRDYRHDNFTLALTEGHMDVFALSRLKSYHAKNTTEQRKILEDSYKQVNQEMFDYHQGDIKLEGILASTLDDIIEEEYAGIDIYENIFSNLDYLRIYHKIPFGEEARNLYNCASYRDVIRGFEDGFEVLNRYLPDKIPLSLRKYPAKNTKTFTLKAHPTLSDLYDKFNRAYQVMTDEYCDTYHQTIINAFKILPDEEVSFLNHSQTRIWWIGFKVKRFKHLRYIFAPKAYRMNYQLLNHYFYNERPYHENGKFFTAYNFEVKERRFYHLHIYNSRENPQQLPVRRLDIKSADEIINLDPAMLDKNFIFLDEEPFFESCGSLQPPVTTFHSPWDESEKFLSERYQYYKNHLCTVFKNPDNVLVEFNEYPLWRENVTQLEALALQLTEDCRLQLNFKRKKAWNPTPAEQEKAKSNLQQLISYIPFYECYNLIKDNIISTVDDTPQPISITLFGMAICVSDFYLGYGVKKVVFTLLKSLKRKYTAMWIRKGNLKKYQDRLIDTPGSSKGYSQSILDKISNENEQLIKLEIEISGLQDAINKAMGDLVSVPTFIAMPWMSLASKKDFFVAHVPWVANKAINFINHLQQRQNLDKSPPRWKNVTRPEATQDRHFLLSQSAAQNLTCYMKYARPDNILFDVFDLRQANTTLYQQLFFAALRDPNPERITLVYEQAGWIIPGNYYQNKLIFFISLTNSVRHLTDMIMAQEEYYKPGKNDIKPTEEALFQYYADFLARPGIPLPVTFHAMQYDLVAQSIRNIRAILNSNIEGLEMNYLFMVQYFLMTEDVTVLLQASDQDPQVRENAQLLMHRQLVLSMAKYTIYGNSHSLAKKQFFQAIIGKVSDFFKNAITQKAPNIVLFSASTEIFFDRQRQYRRQHPGEIVPSAAGYAACWLQVAGEIAQLYRSFARIEYSAKALAEFPVGQWHKAEALSAWRTALQPYLFPEMHHENLTPVLRLAAEKLSRYWQEQHHDADIKLEIIHNSMLNPLFVAGVSDALNSSCSRYPQLFFSQVYQLDKGYWFTFLTNDFLSDTHLRPRRQIHSDHLPVPLTPLHPLSLKESVVLPLRQRLAAWKPEQHFDNTALYQQQLRGVPGRFSQLAARPFHERLYGHLLEEAPPPDSDLQSQASALINNLIDGRGAIVWHQLKVLTRELPQLNEADNYPLLQLLSDILQLCTPQAPPLYAFVFQQLQRTLAQPRLRLSELFHQSFHAAQLTDIYQRYLPLTEITDYALQQAFRRVISATLRHLLSFGDWLDDTDSLLADAPLDSLQAQWLCLGAIITRQLRIPAASTEELLQLARAALVDAGLLSLSDTAIQQTALIGGHKPGAEPRRAVNDALRVIASNVQRAAKMQQRVFSCMESNLQLQLFLTQLTFPGSDQQQLTALLTTALNKQHELLHIALLQLSSQHSLNLSMALKQQKLRIRWYPAWRKDPLQLKVAGIAWYITDQPGYLLPLSDPLTVPLIFRQTSISPSMAELSTLCFGVSAQNPTLSEMAELRLPAGKDGEDLLSVVSALMHSAATAQLKPLMQASNENDFLTGLQQLENWLSRHLFFYGPADDDDDSFIPEQTEHLTAMANHPELLSWYQSDNHALTESSAVSAFSHAVSAVMGASTGWPQLADGLRLVTQRNGPVLLASLPAAQFTGFWWEPVSRFCYLGWINNGRQQLYASIADDREHLYPLVYDPASAVFRQQLIHFDWLNQSLLALQQGQLSAGKFFGDSIPLAWQLKCAMAGSFRLPAGAIPRQGAPDVYICGSGENRRHYYSPAGSHQALPVKLEELPDGGYQLEFIPHAGGASPDQAFTLEMQLETFTRPDQGKFTAPQQWQLASAEQASQFIAEGNFSPASWLQQRSFARTAVMTPLNRVLQRSDGSMVFIFSEDNWRRVSYRIPDAEGALHISPTIPDSWPRYIGSDNEKQLIAAVDGYFMQQQSAEYWPFPLAEEQQRAEQQLFAVRQSARAARTTAAATMQSLPFRFGINEHVADELFHINLYLRGQARHFASEAKRRANLENSSITIGDLMQNLFDWRQSDLNLKGGCEVALQKIALKKRLLTAMQSMLTEETALDYRSPAVQQWIIHSLEILNHAHTAIEFIQAHPYQQQNIDETALRLQQQRFARNYFFGYYSQQLHATADFFQQPWQYVRESGQFPLQRWQTALDQLHTLTSGLSTDNRQLDRLLALPDILWQTSEMQQRAQYWQQASRNSSAYWNTAHKAEQISLLRPQASAQGLSYMPQKYQWPLRLLLAAGTGDLSDGVAAPLQIDVEQNDDLLLVHPGPATSEPPPVRLAGSDEHPVDARGFAAQAKLRLSSPWALAAFSGPAFLARLQQRIQNVIQHESADWSEEEDIFYRSAETGGFLREELEELIDKQHYLTFFSQLFGSNLLVTRLIMTDSEMVFGLLCDLFCENYPERADEDLSTAWFLFHQIARSPTGEADKQPLWLIGV